MKKEFIASRDCPGCGSRGSEASFEVTANTPAEKLNDFQLREYFIGFRKDQCFFSYARCNKCKLLFCPLYFSQEALDELYSSMPDNTSVSGEKDSGKTQAAYSKYLHGIKPNGNYLEIGADIGLLTKQIILDYSPSQIGIVEPNKTVHSELEALHPHVQIVSGVAKLPNEVVYDSASAIHVVDHLLELGDQLEKISTILNPNASFLIVVHNEKSYLRKVLNKKWPPFCLQHPQLFRPETITSTLEKYNFAVDKISRTSNYLSLRQSVNLAHSIGFPEIIPTNSIPNVSFPIRLGNMAVLARRQ